MTRFSPKAALFAEVDTTTFVHQIVTSPGDHCLEITIPGGDISPFWKANAWKYSAPDRPEWKTGACDHTKWNDVDSTTEDYDGYTAAKNAPYPAVELIKYGIKTATPAPTPIPQEVSVAFDICDPTGFVHAVGTEGNDKGKCLELAFGGGKSQSQFWAKDGWKYSDNKVWSTGHCDRAAFPTLFSEDADFGGWTAAKNSDQVPSCGNVNMTRFSPKAALFAEVDTTTFVHQIVTSPGDHCLEITIPGGDISPFWKANAWKYSAPDRPEWKTGACDHTKWNDVDSTTEDYDGYTAAKNAPYPAVELIKYGIKTATPAPTPIPQEVSVAFDICDPTGFVHAVGTEGNDKGKCLELAFGGGKSQSQFWAKDG